MRTLTNPPRVHGRLIKGAKLHVWPASDDSVICVALETGRGKITALIELTDDETTELVRVLGGTLEQAKEYRARLAAILNRATAEIAEN